MEIWGSSTNFKTTFNCGAMTSWLGNILLNISVCCEMINLTSSPQPQGVPLDTSKLPLDQRLPPYPLSQSHQPLSGLQGSQAGQQPSPMGQHHQHLHRLQQPRANAQQKLHLQNLGNSHDQLMQQHFGLVGQLINEKMNKLHSPEQYSFWSDYGDFLCSNRGQWSSRQTDN